jgi:DNA-binding cell septation regulator SpoVG
MKVTDVKITRLKSPMGKKVAFANVTIDDALELKSLEVIDNNGSMFVAFPARYDKDQKKSYPYMYATKELKKQIEDAILKEFGDKPKTVDQSFNADAFPEVPANVNKTGPNGLEIDPLTGEELPF